MSIRSGHNNPGDPDAKMSSAQSQYRARAVTAAPDLASILSGKSSNSASSKSIQQLTATPGPWTLSASGTVDIYNAEPLGRIPSASHLRDFQGGAEIFYLFAPTSKVAADGTTVTPPSGLRQFIGNVTSTAACSYQDQTSPAALTGQALSGFTGLPTSTTAAYPEHGVIHLGQVRLGFGSGSSVSFPLAFTYSNRAKLIVHSTWVAQFGVSYNLNSLFGGSSKKSTTGFGQ
jgi:hypothetical protein